MNIVIDSNVLFSALIKDSMTRKLILESNEKFLAPKYIMDEIDKYEVLLMKKSGLSADEFEILFEELKNKLEIIPNEILDKHKDKAIEIIGKIDMKDLTFVECALANPGSIIWSNDSNLKEQKEITIMTTEEIKDLIG